MQSEDDWESKRVKINVLSISLSNPSSTTIELYFDSVRRKRDKNGWQVGSTAMAPAAATAQRAVTGLRAVPVPNS